MREGRVSCSQTLCPCVGQEGLRVLTPLGRCQRLVCWDSLPALPAFSPWPEAGDRGLGDRRERPRSPRNPDRGSRQHPAAPPGGRLSKGEGGPPVVFLSLPLFPLPASLCVRWAFGRAWSRLQCSPVPGVRVGTESKGPGLGGWVGAQG